MAHTLTSKEREELREAILSGHFDLENEMAKLMIHGHSREEAAKLVEEETRIMTQEAFDEKVSDKEKDDYRSIASGGAVIISVLGPVFDATSTIYYVIAMIIAAIAGYYGNYKRPLAGAIASAALVIVFPLMFYYYLSGRSSYFKFELLIPLLMAGLPCFVLYWVISKVMYRKE